MYLRKKILHLKNISVEKISYSDNFTNFQRTITYLWEKKNCAIKKYYLQGKFRICKFCHFRKNNSVFCKTKSLIQKVLGGREGLSVHTVQV